jgi:FlaA1/EpsC-like NDP-sugar epimerase
MIRLAGFIPDQDIKIQFIGQRPGEKLYEEVFAKDEKMKETHHEKIMISAENKVIQSDADFIIEKLKSLEGFYEPELFRDLISELLPEFHSVKGNAQNENHIEGNKIHQYNFQN